MTEALAMLRSAMGYLAAADATAMGAATQAQCLRALEQLHAIETAARASILGALASGQGHTVTSGPAGAAALSPRAEVFGGIYTLSRPRPRPAPAAAKATDISAIAI